ncbi:LAMI_0B02498g1_1 [Lachancea mirantina]|uniref:LAMI_0B02498g1_1 n=1 Tax=Lachancea mirantina TaxID=1230905 RepID=A0A1G4IU51_9SACH|nr:LAMI_0B02498g1_1 [Lachancea mirantina]
MTFKLTAKPVTRAQLPEDENSVIDVAESLFSDFSKKWKEGKCYKHKLAFNPTLDGDEVAVQSYSANFEGEYWLCRSSTHHLRQETYVAMVRELNGSIRESQDQWSLPTRSFRSQREIDYIETLTKVDVLETTESGWVLVNLEYELGKPLTTREFNEWVYPVKPYKLANGKERSMVITVAADAPLRDPVAHTHAVFSSVELLEYDYATETLKWTMGTASDAGGNVPKWVQNTMIAKTVSKDVSFFFEWLGKNDQESNL